MTEIGKSKEEREPHPRDVPIFELPVFRNPSRISAGASLHGQMGYRVMGLEKWEKYHYDDLDRTYWEYIRPNAKILGRISWRRWVRFCYDNSSHVKYDHDLF